jgi:hypothetical protein
MYTVEALIQRGRPHVRGWPLTSCCGLSFISGVRHNRTEFDYYGLFGSASAVVKPNPFFNRIIELQGREFESHVWRGVIPCSDLGTMRIRLAGLQGHIPWGLNAYGAW